MNKEAIERTKARTSRLNNNAAVNPKKAGVIVPREIYAVFGYMAAMAIASIVALFVTGVWWWLS